MESSTKQVISVVIVLLMIVLIYLSVFYFGNYTSIETENFVDTLYNAYGR